ncbi:glycosyltransferase [Sphingobium bisphenolivorans]|uniref:glycosyltransferase n=1 Tax=Sphingobium bisphenolivorans TaxID=1335760 RepID=UPI0009DC2BC6|nr:glycosyltransferase [Sphingobium bisphenolivorans]
MRICYVGHKFHKRTKSCEFFLQILQSIGSVDEFFYSPDEPSESDREIITELSTSKYDCYIFYQAERIAEKLAPLGLGRFVIVPMYDGAIGLPASFWRSFVDAQFISFSRAHHEELQRIGCKTAYFQYFPEPQSSLGYTFTGDLSGFFWERRPGQEPSFQTVVKLARHLGLQHLHVHAAPDFGITGSGRLNWPDRFEFAGLEVTLSRWFEDRAEFNRLVERSHFFFAPRALEGIGMSFVEAMSRGQIVVAPDLPTMNEYLRHETTGLLYDIGKTYSSSRLSPKVLETISQAAQRKVERGHEDWMSDQDRLKSIIMNDGRRWPTKDVSSNFRSVLMRRAHERAMRAS